MIHVACFGRHVKKASYKCNAHGWLNQDMYVAFIWNHKGEVKGIDKAPLPLPLILYTIKA